MPNPPTSKPEPTQFDPKKAYAAMLARIPDAIRSALTTETNSRAIQVGKVWVDTAKFNDFDIDDLQEAKRKDLSLTAPIFAEVTLLDKASGKPISASKKVRVGDVPVITPHGTFLIKGAEYTVLNQLRMKSGAFTYPRENGDLTTHFNLARGGKGRNFQLAYDQEGGTIDMSIGHSSVPLLPILHALGASNEAISKEWGEDFLNQNLAAAPDEERVIKNAARMITGKAQVDPQLSIRAVQDYFAGTKMDGATNQSLLGINADTVTPELLIRAAGKHMGVYRGEQQPDDRDSLMYKTIHSMDDLMVGRLGHWKNKNEIQNKIKSKLDRFNGIREIVNASDLTKVINKFFLSSADGGAGLITLSDQTNPLQIVSDHGKITMMGEGGISSEHAIPLSTRMLHPSHFGVIDPINTPEASKVGVILRASMGAVKIGNEIGAKFIDAKTLKPVVATLSDFGSKVIALPDQFSYRDGKLMPRNPTVKAIKGGRMGEYKPEEVDFVVPSSESVFSSTATLVPMLGAVSGARAMIGNKMIEQALPLKYAEAPLVRSTTSAGAISEQPAMGFARQAKVAGTVESIEPNRIWINTDDGKRVKHGLYDHYPTQGGSLLSHTPLVKVGDKVKAGQVIADSTFTRNGVLSLGANFNTAYLPAKGYSYEDGIVISESAAKKLTSLHLAVKEFRLDDDSVVDKNKYRAAFPGIVADDHAKRLDDMGVVRVGEMIHPDEPMILGLRRREPRPEDAILRKISRKIYKPMSDASVAWDGDVPGQVMKVEKLRDRIRVYVKTEEPMKIGDKMSGLGYGDKSIVSKIVPDHEMPVTKAGKKIDVIFNPFGAPGRVNPAAPLEAAAGKIAEHDGKPFYVRSFTNDSFVDTIKAGMKQRGLTDKEDLLDPTTNRVIPQVFVGPRHYLKLKHQVASKFSARDQAGYDLDGQPLRGGAEGAKRVDVLQSFALMAHGANKVLEDVAIRKSDKNDEMWRNIKMGLPPPPPKPTFATSKFLNLLIGAGINPIKRGTQIALAPLTDKDILSKSNGRIENARMLRAEDLVEEPGGLFDPDKTGGMSGASSKWTHIELTEPLPNPSMEGAILSLTGMTSSDLDGLVSGAKGVNEAGKVVAFKPGMATGGEAIKAKLAAIDPKAEFDALRERLKTETNKTAADKLSKRGKYLRGLINNDMRPDEAYMLHNVPVMPPALRPVYPLPSGALEVSSLNNLYRDLFLVNEKLGAFKGLGPEHTSELRADLYDALKAVNGLGDPISNRSYRGIISTISGVGSPKYGYLQRKLMGRAMDLVGRSTIIPDPHLHPDDVGIPEDMAWETYQPFVISELVKLGIPPLQATEEVEKRSSRAASALDKVMQDKPVIMNRAPSLHKFSVMAFNPHRVPGQALQIAPLAFKGFNADTDGDSMVGDIIIRENGVPRIIDIADMPRGEKISSRYSKDAYCMDREIQSLSVSCGVSPVWAPVSEFSVHRHLKMHDVELSGIPTQLRVSHDASLITVDQSSLLQQATKPRDAYLAMVPVSWRVDVSTCEADSRAGDLDAGLALGFAITSALTVDGDPETLIVPVRRQHGNAVLKSLCEINDPAAIVTRVRNTRGMTYVTRILTGETKSVKKVVTSSRLFYRIKSKIVHDLVTSQANGKMLMSDFPTQSSAFRTGATVGGIIGSLGYVEDRPLRGTRPSMLVEEDSAPALRFAGSTCGIELRFFSGIGSSMRMFFGYLDLRAAIRISDLVQRYGLRLFSYRMSPSKIVEIASKKSTTGWAGKEEELIYSAGKLIAACDVAAYSKRVPFQLQLFRTAIQTMRGVGKSGEAVAALMAVHRKGTPAAGELPGITLQRACRTVALAPKLFPSLMETPFWGALTATLSQDISYEVVTSVQMVPKAMEAYDLSVPNAHVFCTAGGVSMKNTMMMSVPVSREASEESRDMMPSKHLVNPGTGDLMLIPKSESIHGIWLLTRPGKMTANSFNKPADAIAAYESGRIAATDGIKVGGVETTAGRLKLNEALPAQYRDVTATFDNKKIKNILGRMAQEDPKGYSDVVFNIKAIGDKASYELGTTIGLDDMIPVRHIRDTVFEGAKSKLALGGPKTPEQVAAVYKDANDVVMHQLRGHYAKGANENGIWNMMDSGALGKTAQAVQMIVAPVIVNDENGKPLPHPVLNSYSEGLNISDYFSTMYGQRVGMIDRALSTAEPGEIQKETIIASLKQQIDQDDCGAHGVDMSLGERSIYNRFLGDDVKIGGHVIAKRGDPVTSAVVASAKQAGMKNLNVRTTLACNSAHGVCQTCAGLNEKGERYQMGFNLGALAATTIAEPLTQGVLKNFHQGNTAFSKKVSGLGRVRQLIELPKIVANSGPLSKIDGNVDDVEVLPSGDARVTVGGMPHFVTSGLTIKVKKGDKVSKGTALSSGLQRPQEILETQGVHAARSYIVDELHKTYKDGNNIDMDRRMFEIIARGLTDHAYIEHPGDAPSVITGDYMPLSRAEAYNKILKKHGKQEMNFRPELKGAVQTAVTMDDWLARMGSRQLSSKLQEAAGFGLKTETGAGGHPVARYVYGVHMADKPPVHAKLPGEVQGLKMEDLEFHGPVGHSKKEEIKAPEPVAPVVAA